MISTEKYKRADAEAELYTLLSTRRILHLTLKKQWFDMISEGVKKEEYREIKEYWKKRFVLDYDPVHQQWNERKLPPFKNYDVVVFKNGHSKEAPTMIVELNAFSIGFGNENWGAEPNEKYFVLHLGNILYDSTNNKMDKIELVFKSLEDIFSKISDEELKVLVDKSDNVNENGFVEPKVALSNLENAIKKAKPNMDKIKDVDKFLDSIR